MRMRIVFFLLIVAGMIGMQGCRTGGSSTGGEFFPQSDKPVRKQTSLDKELKRQSERRRDCGSWPLFVAEVIGAAIND